MNLFGSTRTLRALNIAAVGLALAACTSAGLTQIMQMPGLATGPSTLLAGLLWAWLMRSKRTIAHTAIRAGWLWSVPIAMANAAFACSLFLGLDGGAAIMGFVFGPTLGVLVWGPALVLTLCCFGIPIAWSQQLADKGLAGEERGEAIVGAICALLGVAGLLLAAEAPGPPEWWDHSRFVERDRGLLFAQVCGGLALAAGMTSALLALNRENQRRQFVRRVAAGEVPGFRVEAAQEGRVLVRVTELGSGYRVSNFTEELIALDETGEATHTRAAAGPRGP